MCHVFLYVEENQLNKGNNLEWIQAHCDSYARLGFQKNHRSIFPEITIISKMISHQLES